MKPNLEKLKEQLEDGTAQLVDVREPNEWREGHLSQASLAPLSQLKDGRQPATLEKGLKTYLHCRSGNRVYEAAPLMRDMGFQDVVPLDEGFDELVEEGFEQD